MTAGMAYELEGLMRLDDCEARLCADVADTKQDLVELKTLHVVQYQDICEVRVVSGAAKGKSASY